VRETSLPLSGAGKVLKTQLREPFWARPGQAGELKRQVTLEAAAEANPSRVETPTRDSPRRRLDAPGLLASPAAFLRTGLFKRESSTER